ncbi:hypothetical protein BOX15_Mlig011599g3, partial [Macrostomum lignano]
SMATDTDSISNPSAAAPVVLLITFASLWWLLPRLLSLACWRLASALSGAGSPQPVEANLLTELRSNRQERRSLSNTESNFVAISRLDRRANRLRAELAPLREARVSSAALVKAGANLVARAVSNAAAVSFLYRCRGVAVMKLPLLVEWFAPFHWLLTIGSDDRQSADCLTSSSLILLCLGSVSLASGLTKVQAAAYEGLAGAGAGKGAAEVGFEGFIAEAKAAVAAEEDQTLMMDDHED